MPDEIPTLETKPPAPAKRRVGRPSKTRDKATGDSLPKPPPAPPKVGRPNSIEKLERQLEDQLGAIAITLSLFSPRDGQAILRRAAPVAHSLAKLADQNPRVRKLLEGGMTSSAWLGVVIAVGGLAAELAANHGALPPAFATPIDDAGGAGGDVLEQLQKLFGADDPDSAPSQNGSAAH